MTINPYILNGLYQQGIIDYVPMDLGFSPNVSSMNYVSGDAYMKSAMQGAMYQNHGNFSDSYVGNFNQQIGTHSAAADNALTRQGIGTHANAAYAAIGDPRIGSNAPNGAAALGFSPNIGSHSNAGGMNALGGFSDVKGSFNQAMTTINNTPSVIKGVVATLIGIGGVYLFLRKGKKPPKQQQGSKLNPMNWFKSSKKKSK